MIIGDKEESMFASNGYNQVVLVIIGLSDPFMKYFEAGLAVDHCQVI